MRKVPTRREYRPGDDHPWSQYVPITLTGKVGSYRHNAFCAKTVDIRVARQPGTQQAADMDIEDDSLAIIELVGTSVPGDADDSLGFARGVAYGLACACSFRAVRGVIDSAWLAL